MKRGEGGDEKSGGSFWNNINRRTCPTKITFKGEFILNFNLRDGEISACGLPNGNVSLIGVGKFRIPNVVSTWECDGILFLDRGMRQLAVCAHI